MKLGASKEEITEYLDNLKSLLKDKQCNLQISVNRPENYIFFYLYNINEDYIKKVLLNLKIEDFKFKTQNENKNYGKDMLYIFGPTLKLKNLDNKTIYEKMYIKIYFKDSQKRVIVISFHSAKYDY